MRGGELDDDDSVGLVVAGDRGGDAAGDAADVKYVSGIAL